MAQSRFDQLNASLRTSGLDAVILNPGPTLTHLTGLRFHLMERPVVLLFAKDQDPAIVLPELNYKRWPHSLITCMSFLILIIRLSGMQRFAMPCRRSAGWEADRSRAASTASAGVPPRQGWRARSGLSRCERCIVQFAFEERQSRSGRHAPGGKDRTGGARRTIPFIKIGLTEKEISSELVVQLLKHGSEPEMPFSPIVSAGPNSANPHASATERKLQKGDLLVVDWGAGFDGYISDLTRTFAVGEVDAEYRRSTRSCRRPMLPVAPPENPECHVRCGQSPRDVIEKAGYGAYFTHRTGHGIGMEGHEEPYIRGDNMQLLEPGMAFTVEPGIYLPGRNGVRIEDNVVITETGADVLSDMPREIRVVG